MLDSCVRSSRPRDWLYDLLRRLLDGASSGDLAADLADRAERLLGGHPVTAPVTPYLDLVEQAVPTIVLIVLDALSRRDPAAVRHWCLEDNRPLWLTRVLDGNYGRQALLLAVTVIARVGDKKAHAFLEAPSVGLADLEPDLMACYARSGPWRAARLFPAAGGCRYRRWPGA